MSTETIQSNNNLSDPLPEQKVFAEYEPQILQRAEIALRCAPFTVKLFADMASQGVNSGWHIAPRGGWSRYY